MTVYEFPLETRQEVENGIAQHCRLDKPAMPKTKAGEEDHRRIVRLTLLHRDGHGHEREIVEWDERDLYGEHVSLDSIVHGVELAACRDAAFQFGGECVYVLVFHGKDHPNRSRFFFKIFGGQEVQNLAISMHGRGDRNGEGTLAERLMPDILKYVSEKEGRIDAKAELVFGTLVKHVQQLSSVVTEYTDRELKLREITLNAEDHIYERDKKRKEDEEEAKMKHKTWEMFNEHAPKALPYLIQAIQRFSSGPNGGSQSSEFQEWMAEQQRRAEENAVKAEKTTEKSRKKSSNGTNGTNGTNGHSHGGEASAGPELQAEEDVGRDNGGGETVAAAGSSGGEPPMLVQLQLRVAFDTTRFVSLCKSREKFEALREALTEEQRGIFDEIATATETANLDEEESVLRIAGLALGFGAAVQADPLTGVKLFGVLDSMCKIALVELSNLLKMYFEAMQASQPSE